MDDKTFTKLIIGEPFKLVLGTPANGATIQWVKPPTWWEKLRGHRKQLPVKPQPAAKPTQIATQPAELIQGRPKGRALPMREPIGLTEQRTEFQTLQSQTDLVTLSDPSQSKKATNAAANGLRSIWQISIYVTVLGAIFVATYLYMDSVDKRSDRDSEILARQPIGLTQPEQEKEKTASEQSTAAVTIVNEAFPLPIGGPTPQEDHWSPPVAPKKEEFTPQRAPVAPQIKDSVAKPVVPQKPPDPRQTTKEVAPAVIFNEEPQATTTASPVQSPTAKAAADLDKKRTTALVAIMPDGKTALFSNPKTRLPEQFHVGDKLLNGETVKTIDRSNGLVTTDKREYKLE